MLGEKSVTCTFRKAAMRTLVPERFLGTGKAHTLEEYLSELLSWRSIARITAAEASVELCMIAGICAGSGR
jgi:hypothetical protein